MNQSPTLVLLSSIIISDRLRSDLGDVNELAASIKQYGLIQPPVIDQNNRLVAGGRRIAACTLLGMEQIPVVYKETLSQDHLHELEIEENVKRKEMNWTERVFAIETIHRLKLKRAALEGFSWGQRETGELLGLKSASNINYALIIAGKLRNELPLTAEKRPYHQCASMADAWKLRLREEQDLLLAEMAKRQGQSKGLQEASYLSLRSIGVESLLPENMEAAEHESSSLIFNPIANASKKEEAKVRYLSNPLNPPEEFEQYYLEKQNLDKFKQTIRLSNRIFHVDCIKFMKSHENTFDHIVTDPPYGIDMDMLSQENSGMSEIDTVLDEHEVDKNEVLFEAFFPAAFNSLKENGFCITWADQMQWQLMYNIATSVGFKVQRWPLTWVKLHRCMNQSAQYNFTKSTEIAMVCRKGSAVMMQPASQCHILAAHDDYKDQLGHPFVKPFDVWEFILKHISIEGQLILEPFAGRGSGVISFLRMNRNIIACESNEQHYNALLNNVKEHYLRINPNFLFD